MDGHHRKKAMEQLEKEGNEIPDLLPANFIDCKDRKEAVKLILVYSSIYANVTDEGLYELMSIEGLKMAELNDVVLPAIDFKRFEEGYFGEPPKDAEPQIDRAEELNKKWQVKTGDLWQIGEHRVLCGDSTKIEDIWKVNDGEKAEMSVTSPPYGVGKEYEKRGLEPWLELIGKVIPLLVSICEVVIWNIADLFSTGSQAIEHTFGYSVNLFRNNGFDLLWLRIWKKPGIVMDGAPYWFVTYKPGDEYEFIGAFGKRDIKFIERLSNDEHLKWKIHGVWEFPSVHYNKNHPAMFPVELPTRVIKMHSDVNEIIFDPFLGSGTTMVACQNLNRKCRGIEISPAYCAVILERMEIAFSGIKIKRIE